MAFKILPLKEKVALPGCSTDSPGMMASAIVLQRDIIPEELFLRMLCLERRRTERSRKQFVLMLLHVGKILQTVKREHVLSKLVAALASSTRETDIGGWYKDKSIIGVIFAELGVPDARAVLSPMVAKVSAALSCRLGSHQMNEIDISLHLFPEERDEQTPGRPADFRLYRDLLKENESKRLSRLVKRTMDIVGSILAIIFSSPLLVIISLLIKLSSKGPVLFRQERVGQSGVLFKFLKFRSMHVVNDPTIHKEYVRQLISGKADAEESESRRKAVYKLTDDPRVTRVGRFLRRTSLDELPQFFNVLKGDMSLVGPRPPIPYELASYDVWHRRRVLEVKPGITGLWQVNGRSKTGFADMVRLDLRYARAWSLWLDLRILLQTPRAVLSAEGAY